RDPDALPLPAGELVRIPVREVGVEADRLEQVADAALAVAARPLAVDEHRLLDDLPDRHARVERRVRILEDDLHLLAQLAQVVPARRRQLVAHEADGAAGRLQQLQDAVPGRRLAGAGLADEPERLALRDLERDAVDRLHMVDRPLDEQTLPHRKPLLQVGHRQESAVRAHASAPASAPARSLAGCALRTRWAGRISRSSGLCRAHASFGFAYG